MKIDLNLQQYKDQLKLDRRDEDTFIFDPVRRKYLKLLPEELVRQLMLQFLIKDLGYSPKLLQVEKAVKVNGQIKRFDILIYDKNGATKILFECKRPEEKITQNVFNQISTYNLALKVDYLVISNGMETYCCKMDYASSSYAYLDFIPSRSQLV